MADEPNKGPFLKDIEEGRQIEGLYLLKEVSRAETKAGKPYLNLRIMDKTGELPAKIWDEADRWQEQCLPGRVVAIQAQSQSFRGEVQLKVVSVSLQEEGKVDLSLFIPATAGDTGEMMAELLGMIKSIKDQDLKKLLNGIFKDQAFQETFQRAPAAKYMHHAYLGGLLEHTLAICRLADQVAGLYPSVDRSLLLAGALLHDIGKVKEFSFDIPPFDYSDQGRLLGHMVMGVEMVDKAVQKIKDFPEDLAARLKHLILSHHGSHEFGSPTLPMLKEAFVLNFLDDLDAKINYTDQLAGRMEGEEGYSWSPYQRNLGRFLFLNDTGSKEEAGEDSQGPGKKEENPQDKGQQPTLF